MTKRRIVFFFNIIVDCLATSLKTSSQFFHIWTFNKETQIHIIRILYGRAFRWFSKSFFLLSNKSFIFAELNLNVLYEKKIFWIIFSKRNYFGGWKSVSFDRLIDRQTKLGNDFWSTFEKVFQRNKIILSWLSWFF